MTLLMSAALWLAIDVRADDGFPPSEVKLNQGAESVMIRANSEGRFYAIGQINGQAVRFHIDTGATYISIPQEVADRLSLRIYGQGESQTAAGKVMVEGALLDSTTLGGITITNLQGRVNPSMAGKDVLLGNEFLQHFNIQIKGDSLMLHARAARSTQQNTTPQYHVGLDKLVLDSDAQGHYITSGRINGSVVRFMIDTGADNIVLPANTARRLRLPKLKTIESFTAGGTTEVYVTGPMDVSIGRLKVDNMYGLISPKMHGGYGLIGMDFLKNFEFEQQGNQLILTIPDD